MSQDEYETQAIMCHHIIHSILLFLELRPWFGWLVKYGQEDLQIVPMTRIVPPATVEVCCCHVMRWYPFFGSVRVDVDTRMLYPAIPSTCLLSDLIKLNYSIIQPLDSPSFSIFQYRDRGLWNQVQRARTASYPPGRLSHDSSLRTAPSKWYSNPFCNQDNLGIARPGTAVQIYIQ